MDVKLIDSTSKCYCKYSIWLVVALTLVLFMAMSMNLLGMDLLSALTVSVVYSIIVNFAYGAFWRKVAKSAPNTMTKFYLAASALRLITAALVVLSFCMLNEKKELIRNFIFVFFAFYLAMLIFDSVFFARIEKSKD